MTKKTIYLARTFWMVRGELQPGPAVQFHRVDLAQEAGRALATSAPGVAVYSVTGDPRADDWSDAQIIERHGIAPNQAAA